MNSDIRIAVTFLDHPKTIKLQRRLGDAAVLSLMRLWFHVAQNKPDGLLSGMDPEDIEISAKWGGEAGALVNSLMDVGWLDNKDGVYSIHDWAEHNPYAAKAQTRQARARHAAQAKHAQIDIGHAQTKAEHADSTNKHNGSNGQALLKGVDSSAPYPSPVPSPVPGKNNNVEQARPDDVNSVFAHWQKVLKHPHAKLTPERQRKIKIALKSYSAASLCTAIEGCAKTPHNMGQNDRNQVYDDIELILRDAAHIERFMQNAGEKSGRRSQFGGAV